MSEDKYFRSGVLINCFTSAIYLAYASTSAYYYNKYKNGPAPDTESFNSMYFVSIIIAVLAFLSLAYFSYKLIMLETGTPVEKVQEYLNLDDLDLEKFNKMQNVSTHIIENTPEIPVSRENYQVPNGKIQETSFGNTIVSGNF